MAKVSEWGATFSASAKMGRLVPLGDKVVPQHVTVELVGQERDIPGRGWPDTRIEFEVRDGAIVCTEIRIIGKPTDRPIRTADLSVFNLDRLGELAFEASGFHRSTAASTSNSIRRAVDEGYREPAQELRAVARTYLDPRARAKPAKSVWDVLGYPSRETASRRIRAARERGFIPPVGASEAELDAAWAKLTKHEPKPYTAAQSRRIVDAMGSGGLEEVRAEIEAERAEGRNTGVEAN